MRPKRLLLLWLAAVLFIFAAALSAVCRTDPFFHYHAPYTERYYYPLNNERLQNPGITMYFDYDAVIVGTSMTQNFKTTEFNALFDVKSIKIPYSGAGYEELNPAMDRAVTENPDVRIVLRAIDLKNLHESGTEKRDALFNYGYDKNFVVDYAYWLNRNILFNRSVKMILQQREGKEPGITSFDAYSSWHHKSGVNDATVDGVHVEPFGEPIYLSEEERNVVTEHLSEIVLTAQEHPDVTFYCYITPYSALWWKTCFEDGTVYRQMEAERMVIEALLDCENVQLFSYNTVTDLTTDLNHYTDSVHHGEWINSLILRWIHDGTGLLTRDNYEEYLEQEFDFYAAFDYDSLNSQNDYEECNDLFAGALVNREITGAEPLTLFTGEEERVAIEIPDAHGYAYLHFSVRAGEEPDQASVSIADATGEILTVFSLAEQGIADREWHQVTLWFHPTEGPITISWGTGDVLSDVRERAEHTQFADAVLY